MTPKKLYTVLERYHEGARNQPPIEKTRVIAATVHEEEARAIFAASGRYELYTSETVETHRRTTEVRKT